MARRSRRSTTGQSAAAADSWHGLLPPGTVAGARGRRLRMQQAARASEQRDHAFRRVILSIPPGRVSSYGKVAAAAGYPLYHRAVARLLRTDAVDQLPWHRVLGADGRIKLAGSAFHEQRARLLLEGVVFEGERVAMALCEHRLAPWAIE